VAKEVKKDSRNWAAKLKDKVVKHFADKKKNTAGANAYMKKKTVTKDSLTQGQNRGTKKVVDDLRRYGSLSDEDIAKFMDKPKVKGKK
jgi:ribosomal protein L9